MTKQPAMSPSDLLVESVLEGLSETRRAQAHQLMRLMSDLTCESPRVWASRIIGYGQYRYRYDSGREGDAPLAAFATNPRQHTVYLAEDFAERHASELSRLGAYTHGKCCLYVKRLSDINLEALRDLVARSLQEARANRA